MIFDIVKFMKRMFGALCFVIAKFIWTELNKFHKEHRFNSKNVS